MSTPLIPFAPFEGKLHFMQVQYGGPSTINTENDSVGNIKIFGRNLCQTTEEILVDMT